MKTKKELYNKLLSRFNKAQTYFDNESIPLDEKEKHMQELNVLVTKLNDVVAAFQNSETDITDDEILYGFRSI